MVCFSGARSSTLAETLLGIETMPFSAPLGISTSSTLAETLLGIETFRNISHCDFSPSSTLAETLLVTAANVPEREGGKKGWNQVKAMTPERTNRLFLMWAEGGYSGNPFLI